LKNKLILSGLFLTGVISCSSFKPVVLQAFLDPETTTDVIYEDLNFSYALFNQYASGLSYEVRLNYSNYYAFDVNNAIYYYDGTTFFDFNLWDTVTSTYAEAVLNNTWRERFNTALFNRDFDRVTKKANQSSGFIQLNKRSGNNVNFQITIKSKISYSVNIGSIYMAFYNVMPVSIDEFYMWFMFYDKNNNMLQQILLDQDRTGNPRDRLYNLSTIITGVNRFDFQLQWIDIPPFVTTDSGSVIYELNLFTQNQEISIPNNAGGDRFGFEFVAVEWWNILGHLQNFAWWIVNQSPVAPVFEWIDDYIITWVSGLITFITGIFRL
jgi:hypothetical protein